MNTHRTHKTTPLTYLVFAAVGLFAYPTLAAGPGLHGWVFGQAEDGKFVGMVPNAQIEFKDQGGSVVQQVTADEKGYYKVPLSPGTYYYKVTAPGYKDENKGRGVQLNQAEQFEWYNFALTKGKTDPDVQPPDWPDLPDVKIGKLFGQVLERTPKGDVGIPNAVITLRRVGTVRVVQVISSLANAGGPNGGYYEVYLGAGTWRASVDAPGFARFVDPTPIVIVPGRDTRRDFILKRPDIDDDQRIWGTVTLLNAEQPIPDARVSYRYLGLPGDPEVAAVTISKWQFPVGKGNAVGKHVHALFPGNYRVVASAKGYTSASRTATLPEGQSTRVDLTLHRGPEDGKYNVTVRVETTSGKPVQDALVAVRRKMSLKGKSDKGGFAKFECREGIWGATAAIRGLTQVDPVPVRFNAGPDSSNSATVVMSSVVSPDPDKKNLVLVTVIDEQRKPLAGARVVFRGEGQSERKMANNQGETQFQAKKKGEFAAAGFADGYNATGERFVVTGPTTEIQIVLTRKMQTKEPVQPTTCPLAETRCPPTPTRCGGGQTRCPEQKTRCPAYSTRCPVVKTECSTTATSCKPAATYCPSVKTVCPAQATVCSQEETKCPPGVCMTARPTSPTTCPRVRTRCPAIPTVCSLGATRCPVVDTVCVKQITKCPKIETRCPPGRTQCSAGVSVGATRCPIIETVCVKETTKCPTEETRCPVFITKCPPLRTRCQSETTCVTGRAGTRPCLPTRDRSSKTHCPTVETYCPLSTTKCPLTRTKCPPGPTLCQVGRPCLPTRDHSTPTRCPVETKCPPRPTKCSGGGSFGSVDCIATRDRVVSTSCPKVSTKCPPTQPGCSPRPTRAPVVATHCPAVRTRCPSCQGTTTRYPVVSTKCPSNQRGCSPRPTRAPVVTTQCPAVPTKCPSNQPGCGSRPTQAPIAVTQCPTRSTACPRASTRCPAIRTRCPSCRGTATRYPVVQTKCPQIRTRCPRCSLPPRGIDRRPRGGTSIQPDTTRDGQLPVYRTTLPPITRS